MQRWVSDTTLAAERAGASAVCSPVCVTCRPLARSGSTGGAVRIWSPEVRYAFVQTSFAITNVNVSSCFAQAGGAFSLDALPILLEMRAIRISETHAEGYAGAMVTPQSACGLRSTNDQMITSHVPCLCLLLVTVQLIYSCSPEVSIQDSHFVNISSSDRGGAISVEGTKLLRIEGSSFSSVYASTNGGPSDLPQSGNARRPHCKPHVDSTWFTRFFRLSVQVLSLQPTPSFGFPCAISLSLGCSLSQSKLRTQCRVEWVAPSPFSEALSPSFIAPLPTFLRCQRIRSSARARRSAWHRRRAERMALAGVRAHSLHLHCFLCGVCGSFDRPLTLQLGCRALVLAV